MKSSKIYMQNAEKCFSQFTKGSSDFDWQFLSLAQFRSLFVNAGKKDNKLHLRHALRERKTCQLKKKKNNYNGNLIYS